MIIGNITQREDAFIRQVTSDIYGTNPISWQYVGKLLPISTGVVSDGYGMEVSFRINSTTLASSLTNTYLGSYYVTPTNTYAYPAISGINLTIPAQWTNVATFILFGGEYTWEVGNGYSVKVKAHYTADNSWYYVVTMYGLLYPIQNMRLTYTQLDGISVTSQEASMPYLATNANKLYIGKVAVRENTSYTSGQNYQAMLYGKDKRNYVFLHQDQELVMFNYIRVPSVQPNVWAQFIGYEIEIPKMKLLATATLPTEFDIRKTSV